MANVNTIYNAKAAAPLANATAASVFLTQESVVSNAASSSTPTKAAVIWIPEVEVDTANLGTATKWPLGAVSYNIRLVGRVSAGTSGTFAVAVQIGSSTTAASNTTLFTATAQTYNLLGDFQVLINLLYDPTTKQFTGSASSSGGSTQTLQALAALTAQTVDLSLGKAALCATGIFGTSNASNVANLDSFTLEVAG
jgi:hypothetical protein